MTDLTDRMMQISAHASSTTDPDQLLQLLREGNKLYHQGLDETRQAIAERESATELDELLDRCRQAEFPPLPDAERKEAISLLAFAQWSETPAALAYEEVVGVAAFQGISLIPE
ncbi:hypothetical protein [Streptomyces sp. NPDC058595]|uniref:hypothetical protein n=1 Tax=Streptomyces sp. NPDC058595 TaxID=3346550 RepID=UPI00366A1FD8